MLTKTVTSSRLHVLVPGGMDGPPNGHGACSRRVAILFGWVGALVLVLAACSGSTPGVVEGVSPSSSVPPAVSEDPPPGSSSSTQAPDVSVAPAQDQTTSSTLAIVESTSIPPTSTSTTATISPWFGIEPFGADNLFTDFREGSDTILDVLRALGYDSFEGDDSSATSESFQALSESGKVALLVSILWKVDEPPGAFDSPGPSQIGGRVVGTLTRGGGDPGIWLVCRGLFVEIHPDGGFEQNEELLDTIIDQLGC